MEVHEHFTRIDWIVVFGYLALTTWVGHMMRGKQGTILDFFLGGRSIPWQAVSGSIIATEISQNDPPTISCGKSNLFIFFSKKHSNDIW